MYKHRPLQPSSIRIIELQPAKLRNGTLRIQLKEVLLPSELHSEPVPEYEALSYVWGAKSGSREIMCDGSPLLVTPNCETALRYLRGPKRSRTLWIDAICIDQSNNQEKAIQVQRMKDIYQQAKRVVIWLGEATSSTAPAFRYFRGLVDRKLPSKVHLTWYRLSAGSQKYMHRFGGAKNEPPQKSASSLEYLREILDNPYFRRIWTVQEVALTSNAVVLCGDLEVPWTVLSDGVSEYASAEPSYTEVRDGVEKLVPMVDKAQYFEDHRHASRLRYINSLTPEQQAVKLELEGSARLHQIRFLVKTAHSHEASEPKDRVFGLSQLYVDLNVALPTTSYEGSQTVESLYTAATKAIIRETKSLSILDNSVISKRDPALPSWAQDFRIQLEYSYDLLWGASKDSQVDVQRLNTPSSLQLSLQGIVIGHVLKRGETFPSGNTTETPVPSDEGEPVSPRFMRMLAVCRTWLNMLDKCDWARYAQTGQEPLEALFQLLTCQSEGIEDVGEGVREGFDFWHTTMHELAVNPLPDEQIETLLGFSQRSEPCWSDDTDAMLFLQMIEENDDTTLATFIFVVWQFNRERCVFSTTQGHLGVGHQDIRPEDSIVVFAGATMPMVIRPHDSSFELIGPAIIHGIMQGELWPSDLNADRDQLQSFTLV